jgi:hypothetical protein
MLKSQIVNAITDTTTYTGIKYKNYFVNDKYTPEGVELLSRIRQLLKDAVVLTQTDINLLKFVMSFTKPQIIFILKLLNPKFNPRSLDQETKESNAERLRDYTNYS